MEDRLRADGWNVSMKQQDRCEEEVNEDRIEEEDRHGSDECRLTTAEENDRAMLSAKH